MPELSNIQTYEKIQGDNFKPTLDRFASVLKNIEIWNNEIKVAFDKFEWNIEDNGFVYASITHLGYFKSKFSDIKIRPSVMAYTPSIDGSLKDNWICCELLIDAGQLRSFETGEFHKITYELIKALTLEMQNEFKQTGVYFTDEAQDGADFDGISCNDISKLWQFDYALIPNTLESIYKDKPITHNIKREDKYIESWYADRWKEKPNH